MLDSALLFKNNLKHGYEHGTFLFLMSSLILCKAMELQASAVTLSELKKPQC